MYNLYEYCDPDEFLSWAIDRKMSKRSKMDKRNNRKNHREYA